MRRTTMLLFAACLAGYAWPAFAATCTIAGIARTCDVNCTGGACNSAGGTLCNNGASDGYCVLCGTNSVDTIEGTAGQDWICGKDGDDVIFTYAIPSGASSTGDDTVDAGDGDDEVYGAAGDDNFFGGDDDDALYGYHGVNALCGGPGDDYLQSIPTLGSVAGGTLCGGTGNDRSFSTTSGLQNWMCHDAGTDQSATGTDYDCEATNFGGASADGASWTGCVNREMSGSKWFGETGCGCECD